jgi:hypothetical protein
MTPILTEREQVFHEVVDKMLEVYLAKNRDYGNSFDRILDEISIMGEKPELVFYIRAMDKLNRIMTLAGGKEPAVKDEKIQDTVLDLANYSVMFLSWLIRRERHLQNCPF